MNKPELLRAIWCITKKCNFNCAFCYAHSGPDADYGLPTEKLLGIADQLNKSTARHVSIIGGEPFVRKDLKDIVLAIKPEITLALETNGSLLIRNWHEEFDKRFLHVSIGFDGPEEGNEIYRKQTENVVEAIKFLVKRGVNVGIPTIVTRKNFRNLRERIEFICGLGVEKVQINRFLPVYGVNNEEEMLSEAEENAVFSDIGGLLDEKPEYAKFVRFAGWQNARYFDRFVRKSLGSCFCGYWRASISVEGNFVPCSILCETEVAEKFGKEYEIPSLLKNDIGHHFENSRIFKDVREAVVNYIPETCAACAHSAKCAHGCRVLAYFHGGSLKKHDPTCRMGADN